MKKHLISSIMITAMMSTACHQSAGKGGGASAGAIAATPASGASDATANSGTLGASDTAAVSGSSAATGSGTSAATGSGTSAVTPAKEGTFAYDLQFLQKHDRGLIVLRRDDAAIIVSPRYQAKVFTSTAEGDAGTSFGWVHYKAFDGPLDPHMNAYGGENRLWLGPEGGRYSLFFSKGDSMTFPHWKTPAAFDTEAWKLADSSRSSVSLEKDMKLTSYAGTALSIHIRRRIKLLEQRSIDSLLQLQPDQGVKAVGYRTENVLTNSGDQAWTESTGMPCIWILDMFKPSSSTTIVIPYKKDIKSAKPATTDYFGEIPPDRIKYKDGVLFFKADGKSRGKLGIHPGAVTNVAGSYDAANGLLTIIQFDVDPLGRYLNQEWNTVKPPFSGDAMNAYNDGPLADGSQMGPFYEMESVSTAAFLAPGHSLTHWHSVFHFTGSKEGLDRICQRLLGVSPDTIKHAL